MDKYEILLKPSAVKDLDKIRKYNAAAIADGIEKFLEYEPAKESKSRIKKLKGIKNPDYRLRINDYRVFYTIDDTEKKVIVLRIMHKNQTVKYYKDIKK